MEAIASQMGNGRDASSSPNSKQELQPYQGSNTLKPNQVGETSLYGVPIVSLVIDGQERLCLAQISNTLLKNYSYNEIHNRRVALGITCVQCTPVQLEILRRAGAMPISSRRCGMITKREAERLCKSFLGEHKPPKLPENFAFDVVHECAWGSRGSFIPARYNSSRAKCIKCSYCSMYFSPNKFIFHSHRTPDSKYTQPDAANFNSWRRHLKLSDKTATEELSHTGEAGAQEGGQAPDGSPERSGSSGAYEVFAPERGEHLQPLKPAATLGAPAAFLCTPEAKEQDKEDNHSAAEDLETRKSYQDQRNVSHPSPVNTDRGEEGLAMDVAGTQLVEKDIENLARDELQKLVLEQMELRKKLERDFQSLKDNFQDQMKRELAYREEMVQQLQIVRDTLCNELDQERKARYAIQQKLKEAHDALHHFSCKMLTPRHCTGNCSFKPPLLPQ
ncbi:SKI family transcriptional corepressor 1 [Malurus melanocephalus]|uniref:SKI family transcriptional corepressor 1 n=1 Tax=Malurus melanocephalus TaxID=175006 RepID=UPI0025480D76|nr:SKI family transcriptional corepressor 1 [Malurus melanocephalus]